jgi:hypothetical protein
MRLLRVVRLVAVLMVVTRVAGAQTGKLVGRWESLSRAPDGRGSILEFLPGAAEVTTIAAMVDGTYEVRGGRMTIVNVDKPMGTQAVQVHGDTMFQGDTVYPPRMPPKVMRRLVPARAGDPPYVGAWAYRHRAGGIAVETYTRDGRFQFRLPMRSDTNTYAVHGDTLSLSRAGAPDGVRMHIWLTGDTLLTMSPIGGSRTDQFRRLP